MANMMATSKTLFLRFILLSISQSNSSSKPEDVKARNEAKVAKTAWHEDLKKYRNLNLMAQQVSGFASGRSTETESEDVVASKCAMHYARIADIDHSCPYKGIDGSKTKCYGENLYIVEKGGETMEPDEFVNMSIASWYDEIKFYDFENGCGTVEGEEYKHFTQMVTYRKYSNQRRVSRDRRVLTGKCLIMFDIPLHCVPTVEPCAKEMRDC